MDIQAEIGKITAITDPLERASCAHELVSNLAVFSGEATRIRREALEVLSYRDKDPMKQADIAAHLKVSRARVHQLLKAGPKPERAFLGYSNLTVLFGGKREGDDANRPVISTDDMQGYELLSQAAQDLGLECQAEVIQPPGMVNLNRDNLIVACGPRLSPLIEQVLQSDPCLRFEHDQDSWFLRDRRTGSAFRSPMDSGENTDYGYIARLPRYDSKGTFLYTAGIHAPGVSGGLHYIVDNLADLYNELKLDRFSMLIRAEFDPETRKITASEPLTDICRPDQVAQ